VAGAVAAAAARAAVAVVAHKLAEPEAAALLAEPEAAAVVGSSQTGWAPSGLQKACLLRNPDTFGGCGGGSSGNRGLLPPLARGREPRAGARRPTADGSVPRRASCAPPSGRRCSGSRARARALAAREIGGPPRGSRRRQRRRAARRGGTPPRCAQSSPRSAVETAHTCAELRSLC
jgi:hypothetical protein